MSDDIRTPAAADARHAALGGDESVIPKGDFCYNVTGFESAGRGQFPRRKIALCPYWAVDDDAPRQANGYCAKLKAGDWSANGPMLLWEQCKECGINIPDEAEEEAAQEEYHRLRDAAILMSEDPHWAETAATPAAFAAFQKALEEQTFTLRDEPLTQAQVERIVDSAQERHKKAVMLTPD